jgi:hypothetical protein
MVVNVVPSAVRKPWPIPAVASRNRPTIWPAVLIPPATVVMESGTVSVVKVYDAAWAVARGLHRQLTANRMRNRWRGMAIPP